VSHKIGGKFESLEFEIKFVEPNFGAKISLIMISEKSYISRVPYLHYGALNTKIIKL